MLAVGWIEIHNIFRPPARYHIQETFRQIAVRVYDTNTVTGSDVLHDQVLEERCLTRSGFADDIQMAAAILSLNTKGAFLSPNPTRPNIRSVVFARHGPNEPLLHRESSP